MAPDTLLRGLAKLVGAVVAAGLVGLALGTALAELTGDTGSPAGVTDGPPAAAALVTNTSTTTVPPAREEPASTQTEKPPNAVRVRIVSAILHPAASPSGKRRQRARLSVHIRVTNRGSSPIFPSRPALVSGGVRVKTDPSQDGAATNLGALASGATGDVTLRFETAGAVTKRLRQELRARLTIAGTNVTATVKVGGAIGARAAPRKRRSSGTTTQPPPPPPPPVAAQPPAAPAPPPPPPPSSGFDSSG